MLDNSVLELSHMQMNEAKEIITFIPAYINIGDYNGAISRSYYAAFHAVSALLISDSHHFGTHQGAVIMLHQHYVATGILSKTDGAFYSQLQTMREKSDYNCTYNAKEEDTAPRIEQTRQFIDKVLNLIKQ